ncbi:V-type H+-transporting ATPase 16kDa proteolipid subunit [Pancytospora philotis]|nr:V-type H+-transporting ATPase 16kDa proteolipid subunit [Pancytospora philotis]
MTDSAYLFGALGVSALLGLSAYGSCTGMGACGAASTLNSHVPSVITYSYVAMIIISTVFFYAFILAIVIINRLTGTYPLSHGIVHLAAGLLLGGVGLSSGLAMGRIANDSFRRLAKRPEFFVSFILALASVEVTLVLAFLCSLILVFSTDKT